MIAFSAVTKGVRESLRPVFTSVWVFRFPLSPSWPDGSSQKLYLYFCVPVCEFWCYVMPRYASRAFFSEHFISSAESSIQRARYPSWSANLILLMKIRCTSQWRSAIEVKLKTSPSLVFSWKRQKFECFGIFQCALCLRGAEKADITSA